MKKQNIVLVINKLDEVINSNTSKHSTEDITKLICIKKDLDSEFSSGLDVNKILGLLALIIEILKNGAGFF